MNTLQIRSYAFHALFFKFLAFIKSPEYRSRFGSLRKFQIIAF